MGLEAPEALGGFLHGGAGPAQRHRGDRQRFTFRHTRRTVPFTFSMMFVQASDRRSSAGRPSRVTVSISSSPSRIQADTPCSFFQTPGEIAISRSALPASASSQTWRRSRRTCACMDLGKRSTMLRAL